MRADNGSIRSSGVPHRLIFFRFLMCWLPELAAFITHRNDISAIGDSIDTRMPISEGSGMEGAEGSEGKTRRGGRSHLLLLLLLLGLSGLWSLSEGPVETGMGTALLGAVEGLSGGLWPGEVDAKVETVVTEIRLPRVLMAMLVGAGLAMAGACLQGLFRNPLADPGLIGVSSGGAVGAIAAIAGAGWLGVGSGLAAELQVPVMAMAGAMVTTFAVYHLARIAGKTHVTTLLLAGIAVNALAGAMVGAILYLSDNDALRRFTFWTLGSLGSASWDQFKLMAPCVLVPLLWLPRYRRALNAFHLGEAEAYHLGFETQQIKRRVIGLSALMVGATVAFCGLIGFVGLVVPHLARLVWGPDFRRLLPASALLGALLTLLADLVARTLNAPAEIPIGVVTALIGAPFFLYLIHRRKRQLGL